MRGELGRSVNGQGLLLRAKCSVYKSWHIPLHLVDIVEYAKIDKQGRLVIPASVRRALGISGEREVLERRLEEVSADLDRIDIEEIVGIIREYREGR